MLISYLAFGAIWWVCNYFLTQLIVKYNLNGYKYFVCKTLPVITALVFGNALINGLGSSNNDIFTQLFLALFAITFFELLIAPIYLGYKLFRKIFKCNGN